MKKHSKLWLIPIFILGISLLYLSHKEGYTQQIRSFVAKKVLAINGTTSSPSISFLSDKDTGIFRSSENVMELVSGGSIIASINGNKLLMSFPIQFVSNSFADLPGTPQNGYQVYCSDCTIANPCAALGTGAMAKRINGIWVCN